VTVPDSLSAVRAVCLDAGNVLTCVHFGRMQRFLADRGVELTREHWDAAELAGRDAINAVLSASDDSPVRDRDHANAYWGTIFEHLGVSPDDVPAVRSALYAYSASENIWNCSTEGGAAALRELRGRGYPIGVVSNADGRCREGLELLDLAGYMDFIIDSRLVGVEKPDPAIFALALEQFALPPGEVCFVGDIYHVDVVGARAVGMVPILIDPRGRSPWGDVVTIRCIGELPRVLPAQPPV
jgi:putative hydrolase of the HAD superfamily